MRHDITQEVIAEGIASQALFSDLRRKRMGGLHMLWGGNQDSAEHREANIPWKYQLLSNENHAIANQNHLGCLFSCWFLFIDETVLCAVMSKQHAGKQVVISLS